MARRGLDRAQVVEAGCVLADTEGLEALTLGRLAAQLGVRTPSLYNHVDGLDGLLDGIALQAMIRLGDQIQRAAVGRSGRDALHAVADATRAFAHASPGLYAVGQRARREDPDLLAAGTRVVDVFVAVLRGFGLEGDDAIHGVRIVRSAVHGFVDLEANAGFGIPLDLDETFTRLVDVLADGFERERPAV
jgi:AcrR family transcriptional regulator